MVYTLSLVYFNVWMYEMKKIVNSRLSKWQLQYLIHWEGYNINERTWEPSSLCWSPKSNVLVVHTSNVCALPTCLMSQPHFEASVKMKLALPKVGTWSPPGLPKLQSSIAGVKTPHLEIFFIPFERSWNVNVENGLAWAIWTSVA
jgi:hypothetical protein